MVVLLLVKKRRKREGQGHKHFSRWYTALATWGMMAAASLLLDDTTTSDPNVRREMVMRSRGVSTHENTPLSFAESTDERAQHNSQAQ